MMMALLRQYRTERFPWTMSVIVPLLLAVCAQTGAIGGLSLIVDFLLAIFLFAQFRILDDLADRSVDAQIHPERTLVRAPRVGPIAAAALALAVGTVAVLAVRSAVSAVGAPFKSVSVYLALVSVLSVWYALRRERTLLGDHLLLIKYAAFVWIIATSHPEAEAAGSPAIGRLALSMMATYLSACIYEALHDRRSPAKARPALVFGEGLLLVVTLVMLSMRGIS